ncbi:MAG: hypothetical protein EPN97_02205 [Alphaproteobacteria bacterium]|nr:MAG: hypothetical protein EPN97_02205 [Alphaproteobacteria bacterium]
MLKVQISADADDLGELKPVRADQITGVDASACGDELEAVRQSLRFMDRQGLDQLPVSYGHGRIQLRKSDDAAQKADELFYASCCFDLYEVKSFQDPEFRFGEPRQARDITEAVHSALRVSRRFGTKVSFTFNGVAVPAVEQKNDITQNDITAGVKAYTRASDARRRRSF